MSPYPLRVQRATTARPCPPGLHPDVGVYVTAGWLTGGLLLSFLLGRSGHRQPSQVLRTPAGWLIVAVFVAHLAHALGRWDPFVRLDRLVDRLLEECHA